MTPNPGTGEFGRGMIGMKMLIVEDDPVMRKGLELTFQKEYSVTAAASEKELRRILFQRADFDILILDCNLPDGDGFEICRELKKEYPFPIIFLTARDLEEEIVEGFQLGADDYVTKPFSLSVLRMRVKAVLKRQEEKRILCSHNIRVDLAKHTVFVGEKECRLSEIEYQMLLYFLQNKNRLLTREHLFETVWGIQEKYIDDNSISMAVSRLRKKVDAESNYLKTVYGMGYMWEDE